MGFKPLSEEKIARIVELGESGMDVTSIATEAGVSEGSTKKYLLKAKIKPTWSTQSIPPQTEKISYAAPAQVPQKLEARSALSGDADLDRDELRILQSTIDKQRLESSLKSLSEQQPALNITDHLRALGELRQQDAPGVSAMADELRHLRDDNIRLNQNLTEARSEVAMREMETRLRQEMGVLASKMKSDRIEELQFWRSTAKEMPAIVGSIVDKTSGQIIERASRVGEAFGVEVGGVFGEPRPLKHIKIPRVMGTGESTEIVPRTEDDYREIYERLNQNSKEPIDRDSSRESELASELSKARQIIAELEAHSEKKKGVPKSRKPKVISISNPSKSAKVLNASN